MAPGLRSGRRIGHPKVVVGAGEPGGCPPRRTDAGGEGRCSRTRWRAGAAGMLPNCLLSAGMLLLLVRCALAAEEKPTYDASGSSSLQSDPTVTAAPAHPLADLSVAEEVPFSVVHPDGDSESEGEGLSGQPAFSSVLTVMAGTVKHPVSLDQSRTLPTITRDVTHTTQWPSHSSSQGSEMSSSSSSSAGDRILPASSGLTSTTSEPSHVSFLDGNRNVSLFPTLTISSSSLSSSSVSTSAPSTSSLLSPLVSLLSLPPSAGWTTKAASPPQSQRIASSPVPQTETVTLSPAGSRGRPDSLTSTRSAVTAVTPGLKSTTTDFSSETSIEKGSEVTKHSFYTPADKIHGVSGIYIRSASTKAIKTPATSTHASYSPPSHLLDILHGPTGTWNIGMHSKLANNLEISTSSPTNQESQAVQRQQGALQNPTSALLSAPPKIYSLSSHVTQQMLSQTAYVDSQTFVHKSARDAIMSPLNSNVVNPTISPAMTLRPGGSFFTVSSQTPPGKMSLSESAISELTPIRSGTASSEHASNPGDLLMAAGHGSPRVPAININYNQGEIAEAELKTISAQAHLNNSLSLLQPRPESTAGSISRTGTITSSTSESDSLRLPSNGVIKVKEILTQAGSPEVVAQEPTGWLTAKMIFPSNSRTASHSGSVLPVGLTKHITHETTRPTYLSPLSLSANHKNTHHDMDLSASSEVNFSDQAKASLSMQTTSSKSPFQTQSLLTYPQNVYTASHQTGSSTKISAHIIKSDRAGYSTPSTIEVGTVAGSSKTSPASDFPVTHGKSPAESFHGNTAKTSVSPLFDQLTLISDTAFNKKGVPSVQFTTQFPSFMATEGFFVVTKGSSEGSPTENPFSPLPFDAASESLKGLSRKDAATLVGESPPSSWLDIILTPRTNSASHSQGSITSARGHKSNFYSGRRTAIPSTASSAATMSSSDGRNSSETIRAIFSFGTKIMAPYTKWKTTKPPVPFQSAASKLENTSTAFDRAKSNLQADGPSHEHPKLEGGQERNVHRLNLTDPTAVASDPYSDGEHPSFQYVKGTSGYKEQSVNLFPAHLRSAPAQRGATVNTAAPSGSDGFLPLSHITTASVPASQASSLAFLYESGHSPPLADVDSLDSAFDAALTNNPPLDFSETINKTNDWKLSELTLPTELVPPSSSGSSSLSHSGIKASLHVEPFISVSSSLLLSLTSHPGTVLFIKPSMHPGTASPSMSVPVTSPSPSPSPTLTETFVAPTETGMDELAAGTSRVDALTLPKEKVVSLAPSQSVRITLSAGPTERTSQVSPLPPRQDTTTASITLTTTTVATNTRTKSPTTTTPSFRVTTGTMQSTTTTTTPQPPTVTRRTTTTTTIRTQTSRRTFTPPVPRTSPPRGATAVFLSPFTTTTEAPPQQCNITERLWVKTVVSIYVRRNRLDSIQRQNLRRGLSQGLRKALNDSSAQAQVETVFGSPNMTVAYHVTGGDIVYPPSVVQEGLDSYGRDKLIADLRQYLPMVTALPLPVALWRSSPATGFQLKTVLQFVGAGDDPRSCRFSQMMEQRLEKVFSEAQAKVLNTNSRLSVQMLSVSQAAASPAVSLVYTVRNGTVFLNGTTASNLLGQLSAELVGYFLFYPPLIIAEPMEYHNLNTSVATRDFWVITVIQDVDNASLEGQYQSFASLMEQRLAELFVLAGQQGTRFRRATAVGSFTVQMVSIRRVSGSKNPAEMTYYVQHNGIPLSGTSAAKVLNTVDSQTMALTLGYFVQLQAEPVVKNPPNNLWIIAAVLAPIAVVTLIIIIITAVLCRKNKNDFKADAIGNLNPRAKMAYRRDVGYYHQPVQGFDYAKQHLGQQGGDEETLPASQDTLVMSLQIRDTPHSLEKALQQDGTANKRSLTSDKHKSKLPSEDGSVISNESEKPNSGRGLTVLKVTAQQKLTKEETRKRDDPYDTSSGSLQLISIKPVVAQPNYSHPASSDRSQDSAIVNGEVNLALKQKSDIEHYRNKLRLKAKRKGYYDFPSTDGSSSGRAVAQRQRHGHERAAGEHGRPLEPDDERGSTYVKSHRRHSQVGQTAYRSRQSLSSPSPGGTEMDLLVMRERPRRGIRNSGYDTEPELIEETNVDRLMGPRGYMYGRGLKGHSETSTLSSQPSIDEVRQQMHLLLEEAFSLASGGQSTSGRHSHHHHHPPPDHYSHAPPPLPYADVVTSAPGTMSCGRGGLQWVPSYGAEVYQCSLPKPAFHFTQLPEMAVGSPPPLPPRTGPPPGTSLRRSTSDLGPKGRSSETSVTEMQSQHDNNPYGPTTRAALPSITAEQPVSNYSGNPITAVYAIPATRPGYSEYFVSTPPTSYHSPSWMSYPPEPEDVPPQWADSLPLPGYVEAFPHPRYPQGSPTRLPLQYNPALEQPPTAPSTASQQSLPQVVKDMDSMPLSSLSTSALVQAIRQEVAKLAKKQNDVFEF